MDMKEKLDLSVKLLDVVPGLDEEQLDRVLSIIIEDRRMREDKISLQNIAVITVNAIKAKTWHPKKLLGAVTINQMREAGVPDQDIITILEALDQPE